MLQIWCAIGVMIAVPGRAQAEFVPVAPDEIGSLVRRRAKLYVARPTENRGRGARVRLYPGDVVTARSEHRFSAGDRPSPTFIEAQLPGGETIVLHIEHLSQRPLDYSYRGKQTFEAFADGLAVDAVRLMDLYQRIAKKWKYHVPINDEQTRAPVGDWYRLQAVRAQFQFLRMRYFDLGYHRSDERSLLKREADWLPARGEQFVLRYSGQHSPEQKKRLQDIYLTFNSLDHVPSLCSQIGQLQEVVKKGPQGKYEGLEPGHRARLQAEDIAKVHTKITALQAKLVVTLSTARTRFVALGVKVR